MAFAPSERSSGMHPAGGLGIPTRIPGFDSLWPAFGPAGFPHHYIAREIFQDATLSWTQSALFWGFTEARLPSSGDWGLYHHLLRARELYGDPETAGQARPPGAARCGREIGMCLLNRSFFLSFFRSFGWFFGCLCVSLFVELPKSPVLPRKDGLACHPQRKETFLCALRWT